MSFVFWKYPEMLIKIFLTFLFDAFSFHFLQTASNKTFNHSMPPGKLWSISVIISSSFHQRCNMILFDSVIGTYWSFSFMCNKHPTVNSLRGPAVWGWHCFCDTTVDTKESQNCFPLHSSTNWKPLFRRRSRQFPLKECITDVYLFPLRNGRRHKKKSQTNKNGDQLWKER